MDSLDVAVFIYHTVVTLDYEYFPAPEFSRFHNGSSQP